MSKKLYLAIGHMCVTLLSSIPPPSFLQLPPTPFIYIVFACTPLFLPFIFSFLFYTFIYKSTCTPKKPRPPRKLIKNSLWFWK